MNNNRLYFITLGSDGKEVEWDYFSPDEFEEKYWECENIPEMDAEIVYCEFAGKELYFNTFEDLVMTFIGACD